MPPQFASLIFFLLILGLFALDRDRREHNSPALWIPVLWLSIIASRPVSLWLDNLGLYSGAVEFDSPQTYLDGSPVDRFVFALLIVAAVIVLTSRKKKVVALIGRNTPLLVLLIYCGLSTLWSEYTLVGLKRWIKCAGDIAMVCVVLTDPDRKAAVKRVLVRTGFVLIPLSVLLIKFYPDLGRTYHIWTWTYMFTGVTVGKNMLGATCLILGLASLWCFLEAYKSKGDPKSMRHLLAHGIVLAMTLWLFSLANSMTSLTCFLLTGSLLALFKLAPLTRRPPILHFVVLILIAIPFSALFLGLGDSALASMGRDPTLTGRTAIWNMVIQMTDNQIFGAGFESFWMGERLARIWSLDAGLFRGIQSAHNGFLEVFANLGFIGLILTFGLLITGYRKAMRALRVDPDVHTLTLVYIVVAIIYNLTEAGFRMMTPVWFALILAVMNASVQAGITAKPLSAVNPPDSRSACSPVSIDPRTIWAGQHHAF